MTYIYYLSHFNLSYDALAQLPAECARIGIRRTLLTTDKCVVAADLVTAALVMFVRHRLFCRRSPADHASSPAIGSEDPFIQQRR
jgi:hypothetical protein